MRYNSHIQFITQPGQSGEWRGVPLVIILGNRQDWRWPGPITMHEPASAAVTFVSSWYDSTEYLPRGPALCSSLDLVRCLKQRRCSENAGLLHPGWGGHYKFRVGCYSNGIGFKVRQSWVETQPHWFTANPGCRYDISRVGVTMMASALYNCQVSEKTYTKASQSTATWTSISLLFHKPIMIILVISLIIILQAPIQHWFCVCLSSAFYFLLCGCGSFSHSRWVEPLWKALPFTGTRRLKLAGLLASLSQEWIWIWKGRS